MANTTTTNHNLVKIDDNATTFAQFRINIGNNLDKIDEMAIIYSGSEPTNKISGKTLWWDGTNLKLWDGSLWIILNPKGGIQSVLNSEQIDLSDTSSAYIGAKYIDIIYADSKPDSVTCIFHVNKTAGTITAKLKCGTQESSAETINSGSNWYTITLDISSLTGSGAGVVSPELQFACDVSVNAYVDYVEMRWS